MLRKKRGLACVASQMPVLRFVNGDVGLLVHHSVQTDLSQQLSDGL